MFCCWRKPATQPRPSFVTSYYITYIHIITLAWEHVGLRIDKDKARVKWGCMVCMDGLYSTRQQKCAMAFFLWKNAIVTTSNYWKTTQFPPLVCQSPSSAAVSYTATISKNKSSTIMFNIKYLTSFLCSHIFNSPIWLHPDKKGAIYMYRLLREMVFYTHIWYSKRQTITLLQRKVIKPSAEGTSFKKIKMI